MSRTTLLFAEILQVKRCSCYLCFLPSPFTLNCSGRNDVLFKVQSPWRNNLERLINKQPYSHASLVFSSLNSDSKCSWNLMTEEGENAGIFQWQVYNCTVMSKSFLCHRLISVLKMHFVECLEYLQKNHISLKEKEHRIRLRFFKRFLKNIF